MSTEVHVRRFGPALYGIDGLAEADIRAMPMGVDLKVTITRPRSVPHHRLYWGMLRLVVENLSTPVTKEALHKWVKIQCGVLDFIPLKSGAVAQVDGSIAFDEMDQTEFNAFFEKATDLLCEHIIPGLGKADLVNHAREMLGWPVEHAA